MFSIEDFTQKIVDFANFDLSQLGSAFMFGGAILLIGMLAIFAVLVLLWICLVLFKILMHSASGKTDKVAKPIDNSNVAIAQVAPVASNSEIVAVIAAALAMAESQNNGMKFKVVSFKRK